MEKQITNTNRKGFKVVITETSSREIIVYEDDLKGFTPEEAEQTVRDWWLNQQIILTADDFNEVNFECKGEVDR